MAKMTPGPWIAVPRKEGGLFNIYHAAAVHDVALCVRDGDARAIAALPELIEAAREAADLLPLLIERLISSVAQKGVSDKLATLRRILARIEGGE